MPIVMRSALGSGSLKKSPAAVVMRSLRPAAAMCFRAIGSTGGRSNEMQLEVRMLLRDFDAEKPGRAADVAERLES